VTKMKVLIVDDEPLARERLIRMLATIEGVEVAGEASDGEEALERIQELDPELVFLDVRMNGGIDGLTLATQVPNLPPIVFTTAHDEYAVGAFDANAVDYLLKPIRMERLIRAVERAKERRPRSDTKPRIVSWRLTVAENGVIRVFDARTVTRLWADGKYSIFSAEGREHMLDESLTSLEKRLAAYEFLRVHRSELVNLNCVKALRDGGTVIELSDGQMARVSRRFRTELEKALGIG
jgi:DNA-binding LytR/AlgR family response regulator